MSSQQQKNIKKGGDMRYALALGAELGFFIAFPLIACVGLGLYLDKKFNTFPAILIISLFLGIILTVVDVYRIILPFLEKRSSDNEDNNK